MAGKADLMQRFGLDVLPTILVEGKVCAVPISSTIDTPTFVTRAYRGDDNVTVSECLVASAQKLGYPILFPRELLKRSPDAMRSLTQKMGEQLKELAEKLSRAQTAAEKVQLAYQINRFASEDLGGITFMSDAVHAVMGGVGAIPGTTGCLSLFVPNKELETDVYPTLTLDDVDRFADTILTAVGFLNERRKEAICEVKRAREKYSDAFVALNRQGVF